MTVLVGLGNPGRRYAQTRHNVGFMVLDRLAHSLRLDWSANQKLETSIGRLPNLILAKPLTFMNNSGKAVKSLVEHWRLSPTQLWVVSDDLDLPVGKIRIRHTGSAGGHHGVASIIERLGARDFHRLRIGIGSNREANLPAETYVLKPFLARERPVINRAIDEAVAILEHELLEKPAA